MSSVYLDVKAARLPLAHVSWELAGSQHDWPNNFFLHALSYHMLAYLAVTSRS